MKQEQGSPLLQRSLTAAGLADQRHGLPRGDGQVEAAEDRDVGPRGVGKADAGQLDGARQRWRRRGALSVRDLGGTVDDLPAPGARRLARDEVLRCERRYSRRQSRPKASEQVCNKKLHELQRRSGDSA